MSVTRMLFILSAFLISLYIYRVPLGDVQPSFSNLVELFAFLAGILIIAYKGRFRIKKIVVNIDILLILFIFLSILNILLLSKSAKTAFDLIASQLVGAVFVFMLPIFFNNHKHFNYIYKAFYFSSFFSYLLNLYLLCYWLKTGEIFTGVPFWRYTVHLSSYFLSPSTQVGGFPRLRYPFSSTGGTGPFLAITGIFLFNEIFRARPKFRKIFISLFVINTLFLMGTFSRTGYVMLLLGAGVSAYYLWKFRILRLRMIYMVSIILCLALLAAFTLIPDFGWSFVYRFSLEHTAASNKGHLETALIGLREFSKAPLTGIGIGNLKVDLGLWHTHDTYISYLAERGIFVTAIYVSFLLSLLYFLWIKMRYYASKSLKIPFIYGISLFSSLLAVIIGQLLYQIDIEFIWLFYGIVVVFINLDFSRREVRNHDRKKKI